MIYQVRKLESPAYLDEDSSGRKTIEGPTAAYRSGRLQDLAASRFCPFEQYIDRFSRGLHEADMIGVSADGYAVSPTEFPDWSADDQFKSGIVAQNRQTICAACFDLA